MTLVTIAQDNFTGTAGTLLTAHTPDIGGTWAASTTLAAAAGPAVLNGVGGIHAATGSISDDNFYLVSPPPPSADYTVSCRLEIPAIITNGAQIGVLGRVVDAAGGSCYAASLQMYNGSSTIYLQRANGGSFANVAATACPVTVGSSRDITLAMAGSLIQVQVGNVDDGTFLGTDGTFSAGQKYCISYTDTTPLTAAGNAGAFIGGASTASDGPQLSLFLATYTPTPVSLNIDDTHIFASPHNWDSDGSGAMQANNIRAGSTYIVSQFPGAYLKTAFSGTSIKFGLDMTAMSGQPSTYYPRYRYSIDGGVWSADTITTAGQTEIAISGLSNATHTILLEFPGVGGGTVSAPDRFLTPQQALKITGVPIDEGASLVSPAVLSRNILTTGDSIAEGVRVNGDSGLQTDQDAFAAAGWIIANALGAEWGNCSLGGGGWTVAGSGSVPPYFTPGDETNSWWDKYSTGKSRLINGLLSPIPYVWFNFYGTNDNGQADAAVTASVLGWLSAARAAAPGTYIILGIPPGQFKQAAILAAFTAYQGSTSNRAVGAATLYSGAADSKCYLIDLGANFAVGLNQFGTPSARASDGLHPLVATDAIIGVAYAQAIQEATADNSLYAVMQQVLAVKAKTDNLPASPVSTTDVQAATTAVPALTVAALKADTTYKQLVSHAAGKYTFDSTTNILKLYDADSVTVLKTLTLTANTQGVVTGRV